MGEYDAAEPRESEGAAAEPAPPANADDLASVFRSVADLEASLTPGRTLRVVWERDPGGAVSHLEVEIGPA